MKKNLNFLLIIAGLISFPSFGFSATITYKYSFAKNEHFKVLYADYPKGQESFFEFKSQQSARLPAEIHAREPGLKISGNNHSDDLFMYAYKKIGGLKPNQSYHVDFSLEFASNAPNSPGIGGSPGSSVYVKIGAVHQEPTRYLDEERYYRMRLDKGNQSADGKDMVLIGDVAVDTDDSIYRLKTLPYQPDPEMQKKLESFSVTSNAKGEVWLIVGTDSGFEGPSTFYYTNVTVSFKD